MECELNNVGVLDIVNGVFFLREDSPAEDLVSFSRLERKAYNLIMRYLDETNLGLASRYAAKVVEKTGSGLWTYLSDTYMPKNRIHQTHALSKFLAVKFTSTSQFVSEIRSTTTEMMRVGLSTMDDMMVILILTKLPRELESFVRVISHNLTDEVTPDFVLLRLEQDATLVNSHETSSSALISAGNKHPNHVCTHCKRSGHLEARCWVLHPELKPTFGRASKKPVANFATDTATSPVVLSANATGTSSTNIPPAALFAGMNLNDPLSAKSLASNVSALTAEHTLTVPSILDSGCSDVMYKSRADFQTYTPRVSAVSIGEVGRSVESMGYGMVSVTGAGGVIRFQEALHVPALPYNLVSLSVLWKKGAQVVHHGDDSFSLFVGSRLVFDGFIKNRLPFLNISVIHDHNDNFSSFSFNLWHDRLGHINPQYVRDTSCKTTGMDQPDVGGFCESCTISKYTRLPFSGKIPRPSAPLDVVHTDLSGRISPPTPSGFEYYMKIVDGHSSYRWIYLLRFKNEAFVKFKEWKLSAERMSGLKVKKVVSDGGGEYVNNMFAEFLRGEGITHDFTAPHTPQQNSISERGNRTTNERARTMLHCASMPAYMWGEAVLSAVYLENRTVSKACDGMTPFEALTGEIPSVGHIRIFGCAAYRHLVVGRDGKFGPRAKKLILVGYVEGMKNYRLFNPSTGAISTSHDVRFDED